MLLVVVGLLLAFPASGVAQRLPAPPSAVPGNADDDDPRGRSSLEEELRAKREISAAEKAHKTNLNRARDLASISTSLYEAYKTKNTLDRDDWKKLEKAEKLTKSIREAAGGSDDRIELATRPADIDAALCRVTDLAASLKTKVEQTPKHVVSAAVIDEANVLLELIRLVRTMHPKV